MNLWYSFCFKFIYTEFHLPFLLHSHWGLFCSIFLPTFIYCLQILLQTLPILWFILFPRLLMMDQVGPAQTSAEIQHGSWQFITILCLISVFQLLTLLFQGLFSVTYDCLISLLTVWKSFQKPLEMQTDCISPCALPRCCWFLQRTLRKL